MNSKEKRKHMLDKVREQARISPDIFFIECVPFVDIEANGGVPDGAPVIISLQDQFNLLEKFKKDGLLSVLNWADSYKGAIIKVGSLNIDTDEDPYETKKEKEISIEKRGQSNNADFVITRINREIILNDKYILSKPHFNSENDIFAEFVLGRPNKKTTKEDIKNEIKYEIGKNFRQIIADLGFKGELRKLFFPNVSKESVEFENNITEKNAERHGVDFEALKNSFKKLKKLKK